MIHQYQLNGYNIVIDVYSGSVHVVDPLAYDVIALYPAMTPEQIADTLAPRHGVSRGDVLACVGEVRALQENGQLYTEDTFAGKAGQLKGGGTIVKALCLHVAHSCNLSCAYCFAGQGKYQGDRALMSFEVGKQALDFLIANSGTRTNLEVDFFGGEPLLNWDVVKQLVAYGRSREAACGKHFRFTLTTNGVLVDDEVIDFCNREMHNVVLSLDGRREVHDRFRVDHAGRGSYDTVVPKFQRFAAARGDRGYYIRGTFTHHNPDFLNDILHMAELGFTQLSMEPVVCAQEDPCALTERDLPVLFEQYEKLAIEMLRREREGRPITFYHYMIDLAHGPCIYKRLSGCGSGTEYLAVTPWGELFPCHQFVGEPAYSMGNVWDGVTNTALREQFRCCNVYSHPECADCWAKLYCSGGCAANAFHATGSITGVYEYGCRLFRKRMECAIMMQAAKSDPGGELQSQTPGDSGEQP
ncbi:MAG: thioether cross-link-forming SCIFF peptide maturase [Clostridiales bacterium]|nr:thioether cross-link-forming SCIFF peptide maturase [Clostridiales bacterium]